MRRLICLVLVLGLAAAEVRADCTNDYRPQSDPPAESVLLPSSITGLLGHKVKMRLIVTSVDAGFAYGDLLWSRETCGRRHRGGGTRTRSYTYRYHYSGTRYRGGRHRTSSDDQRGWDVPMSGYEPWFAKEMGLAGASGASGTVVDSPKVTSPSCSMRYDYEHVTIAFAHMSCGAFVVGDAVTVDGFLAEKIPGGGKYYLKDPRLWMLQRNGSELFVNIPE